MSDLGVCVEKLYYYYLHVLCYRTYLKCAYA